MNNTNRVAAGERYGLDVMYAEQSGTDRFTCWSYSDGLRVSLPTFHTLQELQDYADRRHFNIVHVS